MTASTVAPDLEHAIELASDFRASLVGMGAGFATIYVDAAVRSMRHARAWLIRAAFEGHSTRGRLDGWRRLKFADGMPTPVFLRHDPDDDVWIRGRAHGAAIELGEEECHWRQPVAVDLGSALLASGDARAAVSGPAGAAMMMDALAHHGWFEPATATRWNVGRAAARSIVTTLAGGAAVSALSPALSGLHVDRNVLAVIESLGWRRDPAARWLVRSDDGRGAGTDRPPG